MQAFTLAKPLARKSRVSSRVTIQNPRPRKYASDAERQKAFRERQAVIQVRVKPETVETFDRIASTLGYTRQEVVYALLMSGLNNNRNWQQTGIPGFRMPRYEDNPMKKKPTPAQLAARERFAEMARSGAFKRGAKRKKNPLTYGLDGVVNITDTFERSVTSSRGLAEHYANQLRMRGRDDIVYVVFGITPEAKSQAGRLRNGVTITLDPRDYEVAYAFHPTRGEISRELKAQRDAERRAYVRQGMTLKRNPLGVAGGRYEILWARSGDLKASYDNLGQAKDFLDDIDRPPGLFVGVDTKTGERFLSFAAQTKALRNNPSERERKPRVVLITNPKQRMGLIAFRTAGGDLTTKEIPILFSFKMPVAADMYGNISDMDFFAHKDGKDIAVTEKSTGFKIGKLPEVYLATHKDKPSAAKRFVQDVLKQHGAVKFRAAVESKPKIA